MTKRQEALRLKGFPDFLPPAMDMRRRITDTAIEHALRAGFSAIDTPTLEYYHTLVATNDPDSVKQIYRFQDHGGRDVGLRFDLTVPFSRFIAEHQAELIFPFKRIQIGNVFRGEKPQRGRYREFQQCDLDIIGTDSNMADIEIISLFHTILAALSIPSFTLSLNHRAVLTALIHKICPDLAAQKIADVLIVLDKMTKLERVKIVELLTKVGVSGLQAEELFNLLTAEFTEVEKFLQHDSRNAADIAELKETYTEVKALTGGNIKIDLSIARGLDYYTGIVFETLLDSAPQLGSICSGGRYDNLVSRFSATPCPGIGGSIGVDRLASHLQLPALTRDTIGVAVATRTAQRYAFTVADQLRSRGVCTVLDVSAKSLKNQLKHAHRSNYPLVIIVGDDEIQTNTVTLRDMQAGTEQKNVALDRLLDILDAGTDGHKTV